MKKRTRIICAVAAVAAVFLAYQAYYALYPGTEYQQKEYSPNQAFYYQKYRLYSWSNWIPGMGMPGDGDGSRYRIGGYLRVFRADGTLEGETYDGCVSVVEVFWGGDSVVAFGCTDHVIKLSGDAGYPPV